MGTRQHRDNCSSYSENGLKSRKNRNFFASLSSGTMHCCGLEELDFQGLAKNVGIQDSPDFEEAVAVYLKNEVCHNDKRIVIVGIPTRVGTGSQYSLEFYNKLREVLQGFGMQQAGSIYKNENSSNDIVALVGQMP